jgi:hypothetical protein
MGHAVTQFLFRPSYRTSGPTVAAVAGIGYQTGMSFIAKVSTRASEKALPASIEAG